MTLPFKSLTELVDTMLIKYQALSGTLKRKSYPVVVLIGNDPYLLNDAALQLKQSVMAQHENSIATTIDITAPADWSLLISEANSYSLFDDYVILDARFEKKSIDASGKGLLLHYLQHINDRCLLLLRAPLVPSKSLQWLIDSPNALVVQIYPLNDLALKQWIEAQFKHHKLTTELQVATLIQQQTQGNMLATAQLIEKLTLICNPHETITMSLVNEHLIDQSHFELYDLSEACLNANPLKVLRLLKQFRLEATEPTLILWILTQEVRLLIQITHLVNQGVSIDNACNQLKIWSSRIRLYAKTANRLTIEQLYDLLLECRQCDEMIKTSQGPHIWNSFNNIALSISGTGEPLSTHPIL